VAKGDVISTNPPQGNTVKANTLVTLYVSTGPQAVSVPYVVGQQASAAQIALTNKGLTAKQVADPNSTAPKGQVTKQDPSSGNVPPGTTVTIYVSGGAVTVPPVIGDSASTAEQILQNAGFNVVPKTVTGAPSGTVPGNVFQQNPTGNSSAAQGATVTIFIAAQSATPSASPTPSATPSASPSASSTAGGLLPGGGGGNGGGGGGGGN
jgi:serine/threonine-protein kinase